ncbi:MAG TPA: hypothetical protein VF267_06950 [Gammaproteobacteria bacterium]
MSGQQNQWSDASMDDGSDPDSKAGANVTPELGRKIRLQMLLEDRKRANAVRAKVSSELLGVLLAMKEGMQELRSMRPDLKEELRGRGVIYDQLYARPYDRICEMRTEMLQRFTRVYNDLETLARSEDDNDDIALRALQPVADDLLEVLHLMIDGMASVREYRARLGADLLKNGDIYEKLYNTVFSRISVVRDSLPILMNAVFGRRIFRR